LEVILEVIGSADRLPYKSLWPAGRIAVGQKEFGKEIFEVELKWIKKDPHVAS
jgi:hypothetical protein